MRRLAPLFLLLLPVTASADGAIERRMYSDQVTSSTFLWNDWNKFQENYHPAYAMDGDPATAWVEGAKGSGAGEWVRFAVTPLQGATSARLRIHNGYQKSASLYKANARIKQATVTLLPSGVSQTVTLTDGQDWQEIKVAQPSGPIEGIQLKVDSVYAGSKYEDLCVSDVEIYVTSTTRDNPVAENARLTRLLAWKKSRVDAAAAFKTATAGQMPVLPGYSLRTEQGVNLTYGDDANTEPWGSAVATVRALGLLPAYDRLPTPTAAINIAVAGFTSNFAGWSPVQVAPTDTRPIPSVDGLAASQLWNCYEGPPVWGSEDSGEAGGTMELPVAGKLGYLQASTIGTFAVQDNPSIADALEGKPAACSKANTDNPKVYAWASITPAAGGVPAHVSALLTVSCGMVESREGYERVAVPQLLVYDEAGRLNVLVGRQYATVFGWRQSGTGYAIEDARRVGRWEGVIRASETKAVASQ